MNDANTEAEKKLQAIAQIVASETKNELARLHKALDTYRLMDADRYAMIPKVSEDEIQPYPGSLFDRAIRRELPDTLQCPQCGALGVRESYCAFECRGSLSCRWFRAKEESTFGPNPRNRH